MVLNLLLLALYRLYIPIRETTSWEVLSATHLGTARSKSNSISHDTVTQHEMISVVVVEISINLSSFDFFFPSYFCPLFTLLVFSFADFGFVRFSVNQLCYLLCCTYILFLS